MNVAIHWFRCDFRLTDNVALHTAVAQSDVVVPIFIFDPAILKAPDTGAPIVGFMLECLASLERDIEASGGKLIFRHGPVEEEMRQIFQSTNAAALYFNRDYEPQARSRDDAMKKMVESLGAEVHSFKDGVLQEPEEVLKPDGTPYRVFTAYSKAWRARPQDAVLPKVQFKRPPAFKSPRGLKLPTVRELGFDLNIKLIPGGEAAAHLRLKQFAADGLLHYADRRDIPSHRGTSALSPHLRLGTLSARTVLATVAKAAAGAPAASKQTLTFEGELIWREFYRSILWHFPHVATSSFKEQYQDLKWENNERFFRAWCEGRTGYPIVDAGMRQLNTTGWMHNRVRMIVAAFLCKDLLVSYQWGERYFMQKLMDADLATNNGGWQWSASTGTDAQPYFRIFNPASQAVKFDPEGEYIRRYIPEAELLDYPPPIVDHARQRAKALALFQHR